VVFVATSKNKNFTEDIWIVDSGACRHYCNSSEGLFKVEGSVLVIFDRVMTTKNDSVSKIKVLMNESHVVHNTISSPFYGKKVEINEFHKMLGHHGSDRFENTAKIHDLKMKGEFKTFEKCAIAKARHNNFNKD
jgi:hypothetical protein